MMKRWIAVALALTAGMGWFVWRWGGAAVESDRVTAPVERGPFEVTVAARGKLAAARSIRVTAPVAWKPIIWLVPEGSRVEKGDLIVRFEKTDIEESIREAEANLAIHLARLDEARMSLEHQREEIKARIEENRAALRVAEVELEDLRNRPRPSELRKAEVEARVARAILETARGEYEITLEMLSDESQAGAVDQSTLRQRELEFHKARVDLEASERKLRSVRAGTHPDLIREAELRASQSRLDLEQAQRELGDKTVELEAEIRRARAEVEKSDNRLERARDELEKTDLHSPADGMVAYLTVFNKKIAKGLKVFEGASIVDLPDVTSMTLRARVRESEISRLFEGQSAEVSVDAIPGEVFPGAVSRVGKIAKDSSEMELIGFGQEREDTGVKVFDVTIDIDATHPQFRPNMIGRARILVWSADDVLRVPRDAVVERDGRAFVHVARGGGAREREVELGRGNDDFFQVLEGLEAGERVVLNPGGETP